MYTQPITKERTRYRLSDTMIAKLPPQDAESRSEEKEWVDSESIGLRLSVSKTGRKWWDFRYRLRGRKMAIRIGEWPSVSTTEARNRANALKARVSLGHDPSAEKIAERAIPTVAEFCEEYLVHARRTIRTAKDTEQRLRKWVLPKIGKMRIDSVGRGDIERLRAAWLDSMSLATVNRVLASLKALFSHAVRLEVIDRSPAELVRLQREDNARVRCLAGEELARYVAAVEEEPNVFLRNYLKFLLATGVRRSEALEARWDNVSIPNRTLHLLKTKSGKPRTVILNDAAMDVIDSLPRREGNPFLFPGASGSSHLVEPKFAHERACTRAGITNLRLHDLRHTFASLAVSAGSSLFSVQTMLGHASPIMSQRYSHLSSDAVRQASQTVSAALMAAAPKAEPDPKPEPAATPPTPEAKEAPPQPMKGTAA